MGREGWVAEDYLQVLWNRPASVTEAPDAFPLPQKSQLVSWVRSVARDHRQYPVIWHPEEVATG